MDVAVVHVHGFHPSSITTPFLSAHRQNCIINLYFHLSPRCSSTHMNSRSGALRTFLGTGEVESLEADACAGWREGGATRST
ncbi:hypothetical protein K443DRAFT_674735 [Laccaria amethystina LaAM-08-1]|uniref:Uncharacterized protein n=1 Tax=Laccaria amethystina LaAM-08-1 TaxID=1095629 RepID=A0A0C9YCH1_9AGAR|nr:hypothetical protein K443DRAFT_674735 [Laccaria amethystina LaAM-08-1]